MWKKLLEFILARVVIKTAADYATGKPVTGGSVARDAAGTVAETLSEVQEPPKGE